MIKLLLLAGGGAAGTLMRYGVNGWVSNHQDRHLPWAAVFPLGTMLVNVSGCFIIGFLATLSSTDLGRGWLKPEWRDFWLVGFCGGYTTFSSYGLQTLDLARDAEWLWLALNVIGSNVLCLLAVWLGRLCALGLMKT